MKKSRTSFVTMGIPSLFLVFSVLCLVILSLFTYSTSMHDLRMSQAAMNQTTAYYEACSKASSAYEQTEELLKKLAETSQSQNEYYTSIDNHFRKSEELLWQSDSKTLSGDFEISDTQLLHIELQILYPSSAASSRLKILTWNTQSFGSWNPDTTQPVYKGDNYDTDSHP